jgi:hypothetical protein
MRRTNNIYSRKGLKKRWRRLTKVYNIWAETKKEPGLGLNILENKQYVDDA